MAQPITQLRQFTKAELLRYVRQTQEENHRLTMMINQPHESANDLFWIRHSIKKNVESLRDVNRIMDEKGWIA